jgi:hypothetical protein
MTVLYMHRNTPIPRLDPRLSLLQPLMDRMLAKEPDDRYADAAATAAAITAARALWLAEANGA